MDNKQDLSKNKREYRYERKFAVEGHTAQEVESLVKENPALFFESFPPRQVNNIYLDSEGLKNYCDSVNGISERLKVRVRWYGPLFGAIKDPTLEFKFKKGEVVIKRSYPLVQFIFQKNFSYDHLNDAFRRSSLPHAVSEILRASRLSLINCYVRKYFTTPHKENRLTIDDNLCFLRATNANNGFTEEIKSSMIIVELKYHLSNEGTEEKISSHFPFRLTKSSKYVQGIQLLYY